MSVYSESQRQKFFTRSEAAGTPSDLNKGITSKLDVYNLVTSIFKETKSMPFEIDFLQVHKVIDTRNKVATDASKFGMVSGKFIYSDSKHLDKPVQCFPMDVDNFELPIPGEVVVVVKYHSKNYYFDKLTVGGKGSNYDEAIHYQFLRPDVVSAIKKNIDGYGAPKAPKKRPFVEQGGKVIASRYGSSILFDHRDAKPIIRLSNNHSQQASVAYFESGFKQEGSTILLDSSNTKNFPRPVVNGIRNWGRLNGSNDKVIINSDQLIFQSRYKAFHMNSATEMHLNAPNVYINNEPAVLGNQLKSVLEDILDLMGTMIKGISASPTAGPALNPPNAGNELLAIQGKLQDFLANEEGLHDIQALDSKFKDDLKAADIREV
mgnify:CR=1 FL=1